MENKKTINPKLLSKLSQLCERNNKIDPNLYQKYNVKRGLRDISGQGVLTGLTEISEISSYIIKDSDMIPCDGNLFYRGININDIVEGFISSNNFGFEETIYLLLFGELPNKESLTNFNNILADYRTLPIDFIRNIIMQNPGKDMMNTLARCVLAMYTYDNNPEDLSIENILSQSLKLISILPLLAAYGYQAYQYYNNKKSFIIHNPVKEFCTAENILHLLRPDSKFTNLESQILDISLVLHAEHGGGNNSTFTTHVVSSAGTDTYSAITSALCSLKGIKHGGANVKVIKMFKDLKKTVKDLKDEEEVGTYLRSLLKKEKFDKTGLIYGMGHAVYSISDPRTKILKVFLKKLCKEKNLLKEFELYNMVENIAPKIIAEERKIYKGVSANIDFYSGLLYEILNLPLELYTPIFAVSRITGWCAHRLEEVINTGKIIRPSYKSITKHKKYVKLNKRL